MEEGDDLKQNSIRLKDYELEELKAIILFAMKNGYDTKDYTSSVIERVGKDIYHDCGY